MSKYQKGANFERALVREFWANGFAAMRAAGSGSAPFSLPDLIAIRSGRIIAIECKTCSKDSFYLDKEDLGKMRMFRDVSGCEAYIAVKFNNVKPKFFPLDLVMRKKVSKNDTSISFESVLGVQSTL
ncbi:MAG: Holliday junction resolvase [Candidatus Altiarchaeota archaeon]|nr:Holliday junction resolvase [Candidatus Altiarchaeota archaeon]